MAVDTQHEQYKKYLPLWERCDDAADGQDKIHTGGEKYLPRLKDQSVSDYSAYKNRAAFFNATGRTVSGLHGMLFRKPIIVSADDGLAELLDDVTLAGESLNDFAASLAHEFIEVGRVGVLVDYPPANTDGLTQAQVSALNLRPYMKMYDTKNIINWKTGRANNQHVLTQIVLTESHQVEKTEFESVEQIRYRVLDLCEGRYRQRVFIINDKKEDVLIEEFYPVMQGRNLTRIPFFIINATSLKAEPEEPPLLDLVDMNLAHYRVTADYEHGCHFTGLPTPVITGYSNDGSGEGLYIGSTSAWVFPDPDAKAFYLEFTGQGLESLERNLDRKEQQMAILGARILSHDKKAVEAAETAAIHRAGENSILATMATMLSSGLTAALSVFSEWAGFGPDASLQINRDFNAVPMTATELTALVGAWQAGAISQETLFDNLNAGELYVDGTKFEDEKARLSREKQPIL